MQEEAGASTGLRHYQGYAEFAGAKRVSALKKIDKSVHWESRMGTAKQASDYATKADTRVAGPWIWGELANPEPTPGKRTDLEDAMQLYEAEGIDAVVEQHPTTYARYYRGMDRVLFIKNRHQIRDNAPTVTLLYGPPGCGKSRYVHDNVEKVYTIPVTDGFWFDNYFNDDNVLLDEFEGAASKWTLTNLNRVLDRYAVMLPTKGGFTHWKPKHIYITTNTHPLNWYNYENRQDRYKALARRFTKVMKWDNVDEEPHVYETEQELKEFF